MWQHEHLNVLTHKCLHEAFNFTTMTALNQTAEMVRRNKVVASDGSDIYLPGAHDKKRLERDDFRSHVTYLNIPITFMRGRIIYKTRMHVLMCI